ncbi:MAG: protein kinase domain-containing protein, partial [Myxococcota bacterium]
AGAGLAAAHRAGLVHRDFKPDNVLVGADGITRVSDFGVSRRVTPDGASAEDDTITGAGSLIGTPRYMSPEQFDGRPADPRSDQFSFCVALFEALCGQRPFDGDTLRALSDAAHAGPPQRIPAKTALPRWLEAVVLRGLAPRPEQRFPSMDELLTALAGPSRRRALLWPAVTAAAVLAAGLLTWRELARRRADPCRQVDARAAAAWTEADRAALAGSLDGAKVPWASTTGVHVDALFRGFVSRWSTEYESLCRARDEGLDERALATRQACLDERLASFVALKTKMAGASAPLRESLGRLRMVLETRECGVRPWFLEVPEDPRRREDFLRLRDAYFELQSEAVLELPGEQLARVTALRTEAAALGFTQLTAMLRLLEASFLLSRGQLKDAVAATEDAAVMAEASHLDVVVAEARRRLVRTLAEDVDTRRARSLVPSMRAAFVRAGLDPDRHVACLEAEATLLAAEGKPDEAIQKMETAIAQLSDADDVILRTDEYRILSMMQGQANRWDDALATADRAVADLRAQLGPMHPTVALTLSARALALSRAGRNDEALATIREVLAIQSKDPDSRAYMLTLYNHGLTLKRLKRAKEGVPFMEQAVALAESRGEEAKLAQMKSGLAEALQELGELERALRVVDEALEIGRRAWGADSSQLSTVLSVKGGVLEALGRHVEAAGTLRDCLDRLERPGGNAVLREVTRYDLARSLWHEPASRRQAVTMVQQVRAFFVGKGPHFADYVQECDDWLRDHPPK